MALTTVPSARFNSVIDPVLTSSGHVRDDFPPLIVVNTSEPRRGGVVQVAESEPARHETVLAVCRGMQVLNVARGGTLHQHLPEVVGESIDHRQPLPGHVPTHPVDVQPESRLGQIIGARCRVNSFRPRPGTAIAADLSLAQAA